MGHHILPEKKKVLLSHTEAGVFQLQLVTCLDLNLTQVYENLPWSISRKGDVIKKKKTPLIIFT